MERELENLRFSEDQWQKMEYVTDEYLAAGKKLATRNGFAAWYVLYETPIGQFITAEVWDVCGIKNTLAAHIKYVHRWFKQEPVKADENSFHK